MLLIVGALVVLASVAGGYLMHGGDLLALNQPSELLIIGGAALGSLIISTPLPLLKRLFGSFGAFFKDGPGKQDYLELLGMLYQTFRLMQQSGVMALEAHFDDPQSSSIFSRYPKFLANHHARRLLRRLGARDHHRRRQPARPRSADGRGPRGAPPRER